MTTEVRSQAASGDVSSRRPRRLDAARNYDALVLAAREEFEANGTDASLKAVARRAGVGIATLYRHFPTRTSLLAAVYADDVADTVDDLCQGVSTPDARAGHAAPGAWEVLDTWLRRFARTVAGEAALREVFSNEAPGLSPCREALADAFAGLLAQAGTALPSRCGLTADEFLGAVVSVSVSPFLSRPQRELALSVLLDGLRYCAEPTRPGTGDGGPAT
ncbi:TetR/AcrR family transcriptional regulator [Streptomyces olivaceoviridis]